MTPHEHPATVYSDVTAIAALLSQARNKALGCTDEVRHELQAAHVALRRALSLMGSRPITAETTPQVVA